MAKEKSHNYIHEKTTFRFSRFKKKIQNAKFLQDFPIDKIETPIYKMENKIPMSFPKQYMTMYLLKLTIYEKG